MAQQRRSGGKKKSFKWCGDSEPAYVVEDFGNTTAIDVKVLCPVVGLNDPGDWILERTILHFNIRRETVSEIDGLFGVVAVQPVDQSNTARPNQVLDPTTTLAREFGAKNILHWGPLPVPAVLVLADDSSATTSELLAVTWDIPVKRRLDRQRQILTCTVCTNAGVTAAINIFLQHRVLLSQR